MIGYEINSNFEKPNHIVPHQFVKVFFVKYVCKPNIFLKKKIILFVYNIEIPQHAFLRPSTCFKKLILFFYNIEALSMLSKHNNHNSQGPQHASFVVQKIKQ
jgi:hypothetical protein